VTATRAKVLLALLVLFVGGVMFTAPGRGYWVIDPDAAAYVGLARSLAAGDGYVLDGVPHAKFPPGYPALLAIPIAFTGDPECYGAMRDVTTLCALLAILLAYAVARRLLALPPGRALLLAFASAVSIYTLQYSVGFLRSESAFSAAFLGSLLLGRRWCREGGVPAALLAALAAGAAVSIRSAGLAAIAAIAIGRLTTGRKLDFRPRTLLELAIFGAVAIAPFALHKAWVERASERLGLASSDYGDELLAAYALDLTKDVDVDMPTIEPFSTEMAQRVHGNLAALALSLGKFVANHHLGANLAVDAGTGKLHLGGFALLALLAGGLFLAARRGLFDVVVATLVYLALYLIWPFNQQQRFYQPLLPILLALVAFAAGAVLRGSLLLATRPAGRAVLALVAAVVAILLATATSERPVILGRWSNSLAALIAAAAIAAAALIVAASFAGRRRLDLASRAPRIESVAIAVLCLFWVGSELRELRAMHREHAAFLAARAKDPVAAPFSKLKALPELIELFDVLRREAGPDDLVMSDIPKMIHVALALRTTPLRFSSRTHELILATDKGRPTLLYYSREIPQVNAVFDAVLATSPSWLRKVHSVTVVEGDAAIEVTIHRVSPATPGSMPSPAPDSQR
jgi:hypothetical protein